MGLSCVGGTLEGSSHRAARVREENVMTGAHDETGGHPVVPGATAAVEALEVVP